GPMPSGGKPPLLNTMASIIKPTPGTPAVPILAKTAVSTTVTISIADKSMPYAWAMNIVATPCIIAVPSMLIVAPRGCTKELTDFGTPSFSCATSIEIGKVAVLLDVLNPTLIAGAKLLKNQIGLFFAKNLMVPP